MEYIGIEDLEEDYIEYTAVEEEEQSINEPVAPIFITANITTDNKVKFGNSSVFPHISPDIVISYSEPSEKPIKNVTIIEPENSNITMELENQIEIHTNPANLTTIFESVSIQPVPSSDNNEVYENSTIARPMPSTINPEVENRNEIHADTSTIPEPITIRTVSTNASTENNSFKEDVTTFSEEEGNMLYILT